jgi:glycerol-3-phosphate dehydrogenase (NAD(P)+)
MPGHAKRVLILGHGAMGRAFEALLSPRHDVDIWDRDLQTGVETQPLESAAQGRDMVIFALPTHPHDELARRLASCLTNASVCLSIAKGLDEQARTPAQIFDRHFGSRIGWALLYGPMLARELQDGLSGFAMLASDQPRAIKAFAALFQHTPLRVEPIDDPCGAAWAAILKNVYVPLIGAADALSLGDYLSGLLLCLFIV